MANRKQGRAFEQMRRLVESAEAAGMSRREIAQSLRLSGISQQNINHLLRGSIPKVDLSTNAYRRAESRARVLMGGDAAREVRERYMRTQTLRE
ncbi:hypothetical protein [Aliidiomarina quisquiliarum]|uniref:hypothetical protein n=1 Tax=Aliidiomarina quisquiliarum TaxID=2938947 RepID=UPI00208FED70|nr:hypothetical protein [Aliidiomarina quisquiliarum]MCO4320800.1 hypothetical protein [Aliidiomarina quisquiliarum]